MNDHGSGTRLPWCVRRAIGTTAVRHLSSALLVASIAPTLVVLPLLAYGLVGYELPIAVWLVRFPAA